MRQHHRELLIFAGAAAGNRDAAKDIVQDSFVTAWRKFEDFDPNRDFSAWMRGIVRNKTKDWFRRMQRNPLADNDFIDLEVDIADWQAARDQGHSVFELIDQCIGKLPVNFKTAIRTFYFEERTGEEAADALSISPSNLRKRLERARALLHDCLSSQINTAPAAQPQPEQSHV
ncbi:MAG: sigma-70 family RNA polymerase sigma factor [Verrucomicrobiales bacterium]|nr:sigma-70 family RNA polymerase sigma factor [Verrucomicrobiales bacterium]